MGQILADLGRVHARGLGERLRGHRRGARLRDVDEGPEIDREPLNRRLGDRNAGSRAAVSDRVARPDLVRRPTVLKCASPEAATRAESPGTERRRVELRCPTAQSVSAPRTPAGPPRPRTASSPSTADDRDPDPVLQLEGVVARLDVDLLEHRSRPAPGLACTTSRASSQSRSRGASNSVAHGRSTAGMVQVARARNTIARISELHRRLTQGDAGGVRRAVPDLRSPAYGVATGSPARRRSRRTSSTTRSWRCGGHPRPTIPPGAALRDAFSCRWCTTGRWTRSGVRSACGGRDERAANLRAGSDDEDVAEGVVEASYLGNRRKEVLEAMQTLARRAAAGAGPGILRRLHAGADRRGDRDPDGNGEDADDGRDAQVARSAPPRERDHRGDMTETTAATTRSTSCWRATRCAA